MLWILPACSGWLLVFPQVHWCFSINVSYTRPVGDTRDRTAVLAILALAKKVYFALWSLRFQAKILCLTRSHRELKTKPASTPFHGNPQGLREGNQYQDVKLNAGGSDTCVSAEVPVQEWDLGLSHWLPNHLQGLASKPRRTKLLLDEGLGQLNPPEFPGINGMRAARGFDSGSRVAWV